MDSSAETPWAAGDSQLPPRPDGSSVYPSAAYRNAGQWRPVNGEWKMGHDLSLSVRVAAGAAAVQTETIDKPSALEAKTAVPCRILFNRGACKSGTRQSDATEQAKLGRRAREASRRSVLLVHISPCGDTFAAATLDMRGVRRYD